ncbi:MAG: hypothetical protein KAX49_02640 [Halanaerobiales bacterium]|nr:hypothetical protein [Halanaerobiales bacterium]
MAKLKKRRKSYSRSPLLSYKPGESPCLEITDSSILRISSEFFLKGDRPRDYWSQAGRLGKQFITQNRGILNDFGISASIDYDGNSVDLVLKSSNYVGALPLLSPTSGQPDYGLIIKPRFEWLGIGPMLAQMGWRIIPNPIKELPLLPRSDRKIPSWVLSMIILARIQRLLDHLERRFEYSESDLSAPRGSVNWTSYVTSRMSTAQFLKVPCRYPDLRDDQELKSAIHFTLLKQLSSLESQRNSGVFVLQLISLCHSLLEQVRSVVPKRPSPMLMQSWSHGPFKREIFHNGLQAMEWTIEDRGLAGLGDLQGLPWIMSMEEFFEAWLETITERLAVQIGGRIRTGRKRETIAPISWEPSYLGSQKYLLPDLVLERENETIILDAKYKGHWEELSVNHWDKLDDYLKERHREDLLQILAYSTLYSTKRIVSCLVYPCSQQTWESLKRRDRLYHRASLSSGSRRVDVILTAAPMGVKIEESSTIIGEDITGWRNFLNISK